MFAISSEHQGAPSRPRNRITHPGYWLEVLTIHWCSQKLLDQEESNTPICRIYGQVSGRFSKSQYIAKDCTAYRPQGSEDIFLMVPEPSTLIRLINWKF